MLVIILNIFIGGFIFTQTVREKKEFIEYNFDSRIKQIDTRNTLLTVTTEKKTYFLKNFRIDEVYNEKFDSVKIYSVGSAFLSGGITYLTGSGEKTYLYLVGLEKPRIVTSYTGKVVGTYLPSALLSSQVRFVLLKDEELLIFSRTTPEPLRKIENVKDAVLAGNGTLLYHDGKKVYLTTLYSEKILFEEEFEKVSAFGIFSNTYAVASKNTVYYFSDGKLMWSFENHKEIEKIFVRKEDLVFQDKDGLHILKNGKLEKSYLGDRFAVPKFTNYVLVKKNSYLYLYHPEKEKPLWYFRGEGEVGFDFTGSYIYLVRENNLKIIFVGEMLLEGSKEYWKYFFILLGFEAFAIFLFQIKPFIAPKSYILTFFIGVFLGIFFQNFFGTKRFPEIQGYIIVSAVMGTSFFFAWNTKGFSGIFLGLFSGLISAMVVAFAFSLYHWLQVEELIAFVILQHILKGLSVGLAYGFLGGVLGAFFDFVFPNFMREKNV